MTNAQFERGIVKKNIIRILVGFLILSLLLPVGVHPVFSEESLPPAQTFSTPESEFLEILPDRLEHDHYLLEQLQYPPELEVEFSGRVERPEPREYTPPSPEVTALTQQQVQSFDCALVMDVPKSECEALVALYASTNGAGWKNRTNWLQSNHAGNWYGVGRIDGHITSLMLVDNMLRGPIPPELGNLTGLTKLEMSFNQLNGVLPSILGGLSNLRYINLTANQLTGIIPPELGNLTNLYCLYLGSNHLSGTIPPELGNLSGLQDLSLSSNQLTGIIPPELGNLPTLYYLYLGSNHLSGTIPPELGNLSELEGLGLSSNQLTGIIPPELGSLRYLSVLLLSNNRLSGEIPPEIGNLVGLYLLQLNGNMLTGDVPSSFTNLVKLCDPDDVYSLCSGPDATDLGYNRLNVPAQEPVASFLADKDPDWYLTQAVEEEIPGEVGGTVVSNDGNTRIDIPSGAVEGTLTILFAPQQNPSEDVGVLNFAGNSFQLTASIEGVPVTSFTQPLTLTLHYDEAGLGVIPEVSLTLYYWDTNQLTWVDAVNSCEGGTYTRNFDENWLSLPICHLSEFALLSESFDIFLPTISR